MTQRLKVIFDTNLYIAAATNPSGSSEHWLRIAGGEKRSFDLYTSRAILAEVTDKLTNKFHTPADEVQRFIGGIRRVATIVEPREKLHVVAADPDDDMLFECAVAAQAHLIVSADRAVLKVRSYQAIGVCHPSDLKHIFAQDLKSP